MTHDEAFLGAMLEAPDDETPQLIYADWLEEQGDPERAEFIRLQAQLAGMAPDDPARPALEVRERRLYVEVAPGWPGSPRDRAAAFAFCRRSLAAGPVPVQRYLDRAPLFRLSPRSGVCLDLTGFQAPVDLLELVPESVAREYSLLPLAAEGDRITVAMRDPDVLPTVQVVQFILNREIDAVAAPADQLAAAIDHHYGGLETEAVITVCFLGGDG
jgi:uncharacterized protein (TIGR02996 family)